MKQSNFFTLTCVLIVFFLISICTLAHSQEWVTANQVTVTWDAVIAFENGDPIPATDIIGYGVYLVSEADTDKINHTHLGVTTDTIYTITLDENLPEGKYFAGLKTIRKLADGTHVAESVIGWTDNPDIVLDGKIFGLSHYFIPMMVNGISHE